MLQPRTSENQSKHTSFQRTAAQSAGESAGWTSCHISSWLREDGGGLPSNDSGELECSRLQTQHARTWLQGKQRKQWPATSGNQLIGGDVLWVAMAAHSTTLGAAVCIPLPRQAPCQGQQLLRGSQMHAAPSECSLACMPSSGNDNLDAS